MSERDDPAEILLPGERIALTVVRAQIERGEEPSPNVATVCVMALERLAATVQRVRALCGDNAIYADFGEPPNEYVVPGVMESDLRAALDTPDADR